MRKQTVSLVAVLLVIAAGLAAQPAAPAGVATGDLKLRDWKPRSQMVVKESRILRPKFPVIDMHNHLGKIANTARYLEEMDKAGVWKCVSLDGGAVTERTKPSYQEHLAASRAVSKDRFLVFFRPDFSTIDAPDWGRREAQKLEEAVKAGARGLKIAKELGMGVKDKSGKLIRVDDPRIDPVWAKCGELGIPVMMHISDPKAFFTPFDEYNERYDEMRAHPNYRKFTPDPEGGMVWKTALLNQRNRVIARHPETVFIGAHVANQPEELHVVGMWLDLYPNFYADIDARISELGRQPYTARKFLIRYQDRVLFGTDTDPDAEAYRIYYRFLETDDEYFDPALSHHQQGRWMIYGVYLPDEVLEKIYNKNALKILSRCKFQ
jgi:predicted TIM-barrel fold metal-dependent hydrolase